MSKDNSARMMAVYAGAAPPRTMLEFAMAMEGERARREAIRPPPARRAPEAAKLTAPPCPMKKDMEDWAAALVFWFVILAVLCGL
jgi:hypothetical protein